MQVDAIALRLRLRGPMEASDLGVRLLQESRAAVYSCYFLAALPVVVLCLACYEIANWLPGLLLWWAKPWLDRSILFALSRAAFGQNSSWRDLWHERRGVWFKQVLNTLTMRRLSPWRAFTQPIHQLEGQTGSDLRKRVKQVRKGKTGKAILMTSAFSLLEMCLAFALLSLLFWFAPAGQQIEPYSLFYDRSTSSSLALFSTLSYAAIVLFLEPFYVAAGFGMYLSRRVELEAWDIEQELRRAFA